MAESLMERSVSMITNQLKSKFPTALAQVSADRTDNYVSLPVPQQYFLSGGRLALKTPTVFVVGDRIDFRLGTKGANHVNAICRVYVTILVEDRDSDHLTQKSYRYQAAMHQILNNASLTLAGTNIKVIVKVADAAFSDIFRDNGSTDPQGRFRKEVSLTCECEHYENFIGGY